MIGANRVSLEARCVIPTVCHPEPAETARDLTDNENVTQIILV
jgi:hypothetical protein